jgi:outer membrane protein
MRFGSIALAAFLVACGTEAATAQSTGLAGTFQARLRAVTVSPDPSATITVSGAAIGGRTRATDSVVPEFDISYFVTDNISVELIAAVTRHTVTNSVAGRVASVSLLPPTVTAQYHFDPEGPIRPYVGAGLNYTFFYDAASTLPQISFSRNVCFALQAGVDIPVSDGYFINLDVKKLFLNTSITASSGAVRAKASLDPWLIGVGVGLRF